MRARALTLACVGLLLTGSARADGPVTLEGRWSAGPLTTRWVVGDWGASCGPKPSGGGEGAASVIIKQSGNELLISGGGRTYSTAQCWEQYPGILRMNHSASPRSWKTVCKTAPADPRQASLSTSLTATDDSISFYEAGQYQFVIQGQNCTASVGRYRNYTLVQRAGTLESPPPPEPASAAPPAPEPVKKPEPASDRCKSPGAPARLEVRPAKKLLRAGEEFEFRAIVSDAQGCLVGGRPTWTVEAGGDRAELTAPGKVRLKPDAAEGEVHLTASVGGRSAEVTIEVASADRYDALLRSGAFNAAGEVDEAASVAIASQSIGAASAVAEDRATGRKRTFVALVAVVALVLAGVGVWVLRRSRRAAAMQQRRYEAQKDKYEAALRAPVPPAEPAAPPASTKTICPVCGTQYAANAKFCGKDGATLLPVN